MVQPPDFPSRGVPERRRAEPLRIGILCHRGVGGSARVAVALARELAARGHQVSLFARTAPFDVDDGADSLRLYTLEAEAPWSPALDTEWGPADVEAMSKLIAGAELDVLHYHYAVPFAFVAESVRQQLGGDCPIIVGTLHGTDVSSFARRPSARQALQSAFAATDELTTVSRSHALLARQLLGLAQPPTVIPNFIDVELFRPAAAPPGPPARIVHVSNLRRIKRPEAMARIFANVSLATGAELWLIGDGERAPAVDAIFAQAGVGDRVVRFGLRPDPEAILPQTHVMLVTSRTESFCLAALEAAACGIPVVAPSVGGLPSVVRHGATGLLHAPRDDAAAESALVSLITDDLLRARLGAAARTRAEELSAEEIIPAYERLYADLVLDAARPQRPAAGLAAT